MSRTTKLVRNQSGRHGTKPTVIVLHTTEGFDAGNGSDLFNLAEFFDRAHTNASSHLANDRHGDEIRMVNDEYKAWTSKNANPYTLNLEQCGRAAFTRAQWLARPRQLESTARIVAEWAKKWDIPIRFSTTHGVCGHVHLPNQTHWDPGPGFPLDVVLDRARVIAGGKPAGGRQALLRRLKMAYAARARQTTPLMVGRMNRRIKAIKRRLRAS